MLTRCFPACLLVAVLGMSSLGAWAQTQPFASAEELGRLPEEELRVWNDSREFDEILHKNGSMYQDEQLEQYVQSVADRLFPEFVGHIRLHLVRSPQLNAFALPNGNIYINLGMLARMENEAQLATLIGHEGSHFTHRHGFLNRQGVKSAAVFAMGMGMLGIPIIGDVLALSSIAGFSRDKEREADDGGYRRMLRAGYDPRESVKIFEHLIAEVKALEMKEPFFFSSHPQLQERVAAFKALIARDGATGETNRDAFLEQTRNARMDNLENENSMNRFKSVILELEDEQRRATYLPEAQYYLGEAYRQRGAEGDEKLAEQFYEKAMADAPQFAPSYRSQGMLCMKRGAYADAARNFERYLALAPDAKDVAYVRQYYESVKKKEVAQ